MSRVLANLVEWKDDKGFGFARLPGGEERIFVHAKSFMQKHPRPKRGDSVELEIVQGRKGPAAENVRVLSAADIARRLPYHIVTAIMLLLLAQLSVILGQAPFGLVIYYAAMGGLSFYLYGRDKQAAIDGRWRVGENQLLLLDLAGGIIGGLLAQHRYWHKLSKNSYQSRIFAVVTVHAVFLTALGIGIFSGFY